MSEEISLTDAINIAMGEWLKASGGIMTNFVFCADVLDSDGDNSTVIVSAENASTSSRLGLAQYAKNVFTEEQREQLHAHWASLDDEDD